ncbi:MAG: FAD-dependent oxidoreductase [Hyphomicrobiales bacterium]|nr:MAG: FAD-dependent oxidoreductase [Hyphomicrobiales bacterium]
MAPLTNAESHAPSYYAATAKGMQTFPSIFGDVEADVCVVGAGFTGLSAALHLAERGYSVIVAEANRAGWGASGRNGGQLHSGQRRDQMWLEKAVGEADARKLWAMAEESKQLIRDLIAKHGIDCDFAEGLIHGIHKHRYLDEEKHYVDFLQRKYGYDVLSMLSAEETRAALGTDVYFGGTRDATAGHLHPLNFALGLARAAEEAGARIYENTRVTAVREGSPVEIVTECGTIRAKAVLLAGNGYIAGIDEATDARVMPINNFILATEPLGERTKELIPGNEAAADTRFVVNYWRLSADGRMLFGGGENYSPNFPKDLPAFVRRHMLKVYPQLADARIDYAWGGAVAVTVNRMPYLRRQSPGVYVSAGYSGHGVGTATMAGKIFAEAFAGDQERFDTFARLPSQRFPGGRWLRYPSMVLAMSWFALRDRL